jgi:signal transduction histidine kinase
LVLTNAAQIRGLGVAEASRHPPARLHGVVVMEGSDSLVLADGTAGIYLEQLNGLLAHYQVGDELSVTGTVDPGKFAPILEVSSATKTGTGEVPTPKLVAFSELQTGRFDAQWVEVTGVIRRSEPVSGNPSIWRLWVAAGGGQLPVRLTPQQGKPLAVDSEVRLRGVCFYQFNKARQVVNPVLNIPRDQSVFVIRPAPADPFAVTERTVSSLMQFSAEDLFSHRVRVSGVVTHAVLGGGFWIHSGEQGLRVRSFQKEPLSVGDRVDVLGFLSWGEYSPVLEDASFRKQGKARPPSPRPLADSQQALDHDEDLVQLEAVILEQWRVLDGCRLTLKDGRERFPAVLRLGKDAAVPKDWLPGSRVRVVGICSVTAGAKEANAAGTLEPGSFQILLRSAADLTILQPPPWWTREHVSWVLALGMGLLLILGGGAFWLHRRRVTRQLGLMREQAALVAERGRIARDLHDEIGANLTHISILSTLASQSVTTQPQSSSQHSNEAANVAQQTIRAFDEILWSVNPKNDTLHSLSHYVCRYAEETLAPAGLSYRFELDESFPDLPLPPHCRHGLLLAVKEVLHNVIKHAAARRVTIKCGMESDRVYVIRVTDDGRGIDPQNSASASRGRPGQGLENLQRRLKELGGECLIESRPGQGTQITFRLPL